MRRIAVHIAAACLTGAVACGPTIPPARVPALVVARAPLRTLQSAQASPGTLVLLVRAGSAYDPPGREGLSFALAHGLAVRAGVEAEVGSELVRFTIPEGRAPALAAALVEAVEEAVVRAGVESAAPGRSCRAIARDAARAWGLAGHPYGHRPEGRASVLPTLSPGEAQGFRQLRYVRDAAVLLVGPGADARPLLDVLPPALSRSVTPAVAVAARPAGSVGAAAVPEGCAAWVLPTPPRWGPVEEASLAVAARIVGDPTPDPRVDPVWVLSELPDADTLRAGFAWARSDLLAELAEGAAVRQGADLLLGEIRGGSHPSAPALAEALRGLQVEEFAIWSASLRAGSAVFRIVPGPSPSEVESDPFPRVHSVEELLR